FSEIWGVTHRAKSVRLKAMDRSGNELELKLSGWPAVLAQHEIDHLYGRLFIDRLPDPSKAHHVQKGQYMAYRRAKPGNWSEYIDVSKEAVRLPDLYQPGLR